MKVVGFKRSTGEYKGYNFDKIHIHCLYPADESKEQSGQLSTVIKVPIALFEQSNISLGDEIDPIYDRFGTLIGFN